MFNGTISSQTFTVVAPQLNSRSCTDLSATTAASKAVQPGASVLQPLPCQLLGQTSLVLTPVANGSAVTCAPLALTVTSQVQNTWTEYQYYKRINWKSVHTDLSSCEGWCKAHFLWMKNLVNSSNMWEISQLLKKNTRTVSSICHAWLNLTDIWF